MNMETNQSKQELNETITTLSTSLGAKRVPRILANEERVATGIRRRGKVLYLDITRKRRRIKRSLGEVSLEEAIKIRDRVISEQKRLNLFRTIKKAERLLDVSKMPWHDPFDWMPKYLKKLTANAVKRRIDVQITADEAERLLAETGGVCSVTGLPFGDLRRAGWRIAPYRPSLDRIDSSGPYSADNCRWVCAAVNIALADYGEEILRDIALAYAGRIIAATRESFGES